MLRRWCSTAVFTACFLAGCQGGGFGRGHANSDSAPPLPNEYRKVQPRADIDPKKTAFMGRWDGIWVGGHDRIQHVLVVETISEETFSAVYAVGDSMSPYGRINRNWTRVYGVAQPGKLIITTYVNIRPGVTTYVMQADGTIDATYSPAIGPMSHAKMTKVAEK